MRFQSEKILALTTAAGVEIEPIWATLLSKALEGKNIKDMLSTISVNSGAAALDKTTTTTQDNSPETVDDAPADDGNDSDDSDDMFGGAGGLFD
ncbi:hypothetical protein B0H12DRAFT_1182944 [Mycena haematopus]|nr:hypothetical protein B0H12DRAFT_1182944 [Mycena haematopus]